MKSKSVKISDIVIDGGTQQQDHENYAIAFTDGSVKIGTTNRGTKRVTEIVRAKVRGQNIGVVAYYFGKLLTKEDAYRAERNTCYINRKMAIGKSREWFKSPVYDAALLHNMLKQGLSLFSTVGLARKRKFK